MKNIYQSIWLELPYEIVQITDVTMQEEMNQHAYLQVRAVIAEEKMEDALNLPAEHERVKAGFQGEEAPFFTGSIGQLSSFYEKGQPMIALAAASETKKWDITLRSRSFQNLDLTYDDIINQVLSAYPGAGWISRVETNVKIPGLVLQYEETDWDFLCRLSTHFGTYLMAEPAGETGRIYFGLPEISQGRCVDETAYQIAQHMDRYESYTGNVGEIMLQDNLEWEVSGREAYCLGEKVSWNQVPCQITGVIMETIGAEIWYTCRVRRSQGVRSAFCGNRRISGLSLPAVIKERSGNCLRVHFSIDPVFQSGNLVYYAFAIETTSWYCLPEIGSLVHIYFQNWDETSGIAVHAMRMGGGSKSVSAKGAVGDKSFSTSDGKAMRFTDTGIIFVSDESQASTFTVAKDGSLNMDAVNITFNTTVNMSIGTGTVLIGEGEEEVIAEELALEAKGDAVLLGIVKTFGEDFELYDDRGIQLSKESGLELAAPGKLSYVAAKKDPPGIQYSDEALKAADKEQRDAHNAEAFAVREAESGGKITMGSLLMVGGAFVFGVGIIALTGGFGAPAVVPGMIGIIVGATGGAFGAAQADEGRMDYNKIGQGDFSQSYNIARDSFCGGNQELYNAIMYGSIMIGAGAILSIFTGPGLAGMSHLAKAASQMITAASLSTAAQLMQDLTDGFIDQSWQDYALNYGISAVTAGIGYGLGAGLIKALDTTAVRNILKQAGAFAPGLIIGAETSLDMLTDYAVSLITGQDYDAWMSLATSLGSNIAFSIDPVNMATGAFCLTATDLTFPDLNGDHFQLQRIYNSVLPCRGGMGRGWMLGLESRLVIWEEGNLIDAMCTDGHVERFRLEGGQWINRRGGDCRYQLKKDPEGKGYTLIYIPEQKWYDYDSMGRLLSIHGKGEGSLEIQYQESRIRRVVTSAGFALDFQYEGSRIVEIRDGLGRTVRYRYENDCLKAVCHVDEGVTTYHYDGSCNIIQVIDQNGHAYVTNEYDEKGRVTAQYYPDGTKSTVSYDPEKRENTVFIEALGRTEKYRYNKDNLVTHTYYGDGTVEEAEYDQWTNRIREKDRNGNTTRRIYNEYGMLLEEELPSGQKWACEYDEKGNLLSRKASTGESSRFRYNEAGYVIEKAVKLQETVWSRTLYDRDRYGRITRQTDSLGHSTEYMYEDRQGQVQINPSKVTDALNQRIRYEYDGAGRQTGIHTGCGTTEIRYNHQNYPCYIQDGNGNELIFHYLFVP